MEQKIDNDSYIVTCATENCGNAGFQIQVVASKTNPYVICGVCGLQITDLVLTSSN